MKKHKNTSAETSQQQPEKVKISLSGKLKQKFEEHALSPVEAPKKTIELPRPEAVETASQAEAVETAPQPEAVENASQAEASKHEKRRKMTKVGEMLREVRMQKGLKPSDVAKQLCIRKQYLEAIEDSAYKEIPPFPYGIGFIRSYAKFLGLNSENIVDLYKEETNISDPKDMRILEPQPEASMPNLRYVIIGLVAIILLYAGWVVFNTTSSSDDEEDDSIEMTYENDASDVNDGVIVVEDYAADQLVPAAETVVKEVSEPEKELQVTITDATYQEPAPEKTVPQAAVVEPAVEQVKTKEEKVETPVVREPVVVPSTGIFIEALEEAWVEVKDDNKLYLSKVLNAGDTYTVPEGHGMVLSVGKDDGIRVYINGVETPVVRPTKRMNISLDAYLNADR